MLKKTGKYFRDFIRWGSGYGRPRWEIAYAILLNDEINNYVRRLQIEIINRFGINPGYKACPHITLKLGFEVSDLGPFLLYFDKLVGEIKPFEIEIRGIDYFEEGIIFLNIGHNRQLEILRKKIINDLSSAYGIIPSGIEDDRYRFHVTLARDLKKKDMMFARKEFADTEIEFKLKIKYLGLLCYIDDVWLTYKQSAL